MIVRPRTQILSLGGSCQKEPSQKFLLVATKIELPHTHFSIHGGAMQSVISRSRDFYQFFSSLGIGIGKFGLG